MTVDPQEGRRQIEAMQPPALKVGDKVRLSAGGERVFTVVELQDYDNMAVCDWGDMSMGGRATFPVRSLVRVEPEKQTG